MRKKPIVIEPGAPVAAGRAVKAPDERVRRSRAVVLGVTAQLLFERGYGGATVDEISRRSGVAKTTIYRHWPTRTDLLRDACSTLGTPLEAPDTGSFEADVTALVTNLAHLLRSAKWTSVLPSIIDAAERDPDIADMYSKLQRGYSQPFEIVIQRALRRGELPANTDAAMLVAALTGPLFYRRWFSREPLTDDFANQIVLHALR
ncbi:TetR/AcrR family transcriptional regulator [Roseiarcus sp.]|uniref:TetR/AcrR family transcriptional regulator n=1 Tax=Roseiarcus sp. TaxID=1969460 RepID=UPI003C5FA9B3